jgi:hypothetical protein
MTGALHQFLLGRHYRDLWATPMRVPVLDLERFAGGLQPIRRGGGRQTKALRFLGADGREYSFRSVDKDPSPVLDSLLRETIVDDLVQDGISSAHPLGALVAAPLLDAVDVLHVDPQLRLMPDDPALGEFRDDFANVLGLIEENPDENASRTNSFSGAERVVGSAALMERIDRGPAEAVDPEAFLTARIVDVFLGDWDRHRDQWRWASFESGEQRRWLPIPKDRDQAFSKFDGVLPRLVSFFMPQFVRFEGEYPNIVRLHWNGRELDRRFLSGLERPVWDSIGSSIQQRLTDDIIADAVDRLPPEILEKNGEELRTALIQRRERLPRAWAEFYTILAEKVDIVGTAADEIAIIDREDPSTVVVSMWDPSIGEEPYLSRRFHAEETREIVRSASACTVATIGSPCEVCGAGSRFAYSEAKGTMTSPSRARRAPSPSMTTGARTSCRRPPGSISTAETSTSGSGPRKTGISRESGEPVGLRSSGLRSRPM